MIDHHELPYCEIWKRYYELYKEDIDAKREKERGAQRRRQYYEEHKDEIDAMRKEARKERKIIYEIIHNTRILYTYYF